MKIGIIARSDVPEAVELTRRLLQALSGTQTVLEKKVARAVGRRGVKIQEMDVDVMITVGGDGTLLATHMLAPQVPILGINMGGRGFLAEVSPEGAEEAVKRLVSGELRVEERMTLATFVGKKRLPDAINETALVSGSPGRAIEFRVSIDGKNLYETKGDGVIVATPTGSTGYSLSAGGPVVDPRVDSLVLSPICVSRPKVPSIVVPESSSVEVETNPSGGEAVVVIDGQFTTPIKPGTKLRFLKSNEPARFLKWRTDFYEKLKEKIW